ncbi:uncharacterized protein LOC132310296 [Cornus florida]|uniref:uncharacterized protein LOC132310296 n=1 Tax=Cornus florida TaxID=4283 RepID=UPI0028A1B3FF|nr:uncharacterized protein LOC132310296 [Cornus florida]
MGRSILVCLMLAEILMVHAMAIRSDASDLIKPPKITMIQTWDHSIADPPLSSGGAESSSEGGDEGSSAAEPPEIRRLGKHHSSDKSVAGGGVIIGGLVTAIFAAVYCYIRVTRGKEAEKH